MSGKKAISQRRRHARKRLQHITGLFLLLMAGLSQSALADTQPPMGTSRITPPRPIAEVSLTDHRNQPLRAEHLRGHWTLVFFGFTRCPHVCPTSLALLKATLPLLSTLLSEPAKVLFVSVDPMRDGPGELASYMEQFGDGFTGATTGLAELLPLLKAFGVSYSYRADATGGGAYDVEHSTAVYILNSQGALAGVVTAPTSNQELADFVASLSDNRK